MSWISLKNTVTALGNAYENPMEIKAAPTTTQPHPPSGGGCSGGVPPGGGISASLFEIQVTCIFKKGNNGLGHTCIFMSFLSYQNNIIFLLP